MRAESGIPRSAPEDHLDVSYLPGVQEQGQALLGTASSKRKVFPGSVATWQTCADSSEFHRIRSASIARLEIICGLLRKEERITVVERI